MKPDNNVKKSNENDSLISNETSASNSIPGKFFTLKYVDIIFLILISHSCGALGLASSDKYLKQRPDRSKVKAKKKKKRKKTKSDEEIEEEEEVADVIVNRGRGEMPEGVEDSDGGETDEHPDVNDPHAALNIDLEE